MHAVRAAGGCRWYCGVTDKALCHCADMALQAQTLCVIAGMRTRKFCMGRTMARLTLQITVPLAEAIQRISGRRCVRIGGEAATGILDRPWGRARTEYRRIARKIAGGRRQVMTRLAVWFIQPTFAAASSDPTHVAMTALAIDCIAAIRVLGIAHHTAQAFGRGTGVAEVAGIPYCQVVQGKA